MTNSRTVCRSWQIVHWQQDSILAQLDRAGHSTTAVGHRLYIYGGRRGSHFHKDVLCFDIETSNFESVVPDCPFNARAHHSATLIGNRIWFVGGSDKSDVLNDVFVLELHGRTWRRVAVQDPQDALMRCAHAAELHPVRSSTIVIMGGFGATGVASEDCQTLNDVVLLHTDSCVAERLPVYGDPVPTPRAYHTMNFIGNTAYIFGGRLQHDLITDTDPTRFCCLDIVQQRWRYPLLDGSLLGKCPSARSSHKAVVYKGRMIMHGGAVNPEGQDDRKQRLGDMHTLLVKQGGRQLCWSSCDCADAAANMPQARSAHELTLLGDMLYIMLGYVGSEQGQRKDMYARDCWRLQLLPKPRMPEVSRPTSAAAGTSPARSIAAGRQQPSAGSKRSGGHSSKSVGGFRSGAANSAAAEASGTWRTAKRQRSGTGLNAQQSGLQEQQQPASEQAQRQQQQQPNPQLQPPDVIEIEPTPGVQPPPPLVPPAFEQQQPVLQPPQQHSPLRQYSSADAQAAAAAAAAWAVRQGQFVAGVERCCPASPGYSGKLEYHRHQETEHLREQLQWQSSKTSTLEGENRQLKQQLTELKQDKQHTDQLLQRLQGDCMRHKLSAEQAIMRQQHEQEESQLLRQQLDALKKQLLTAEGDMSQLRVQHQGLVSDVARLQGQIAVTGREKEQLQEQLKQQQEEQRTAEEKHAQDREEYQQTMTRLAASIDDYRNQLSKMHDHIAEGKHRHEAEVTKLRNQATSKDMSLQEKVHQLLEVQQQLESMRVTLGDEQKKAERFQQLHSNTAQEVHELQQRVQALTTGKSLLDKERNSLQVEHERVKSELEKKAAHLNVAKSTMLQIQGLQQTFLNAVGQI